jgi:hypothetical protein
MAMKQRNTARPRQQANRRHEPGPFCRLLTATIGGYQRIRGDVDSATGRVTFTSRRVRPPAPVPSIDYSARQAFGPEMALRLVAGKGVDDAR